MQTSKIYVKPDIDFVVPRCTLLEMTMPVHATFVDDEAANDAFFAEEDFDDEYDPFFDE